MFVLLDSSFNLTKILFIFQSMVVAFSLGVGAIPWVIMSEVCNSWLTCLFSIYRTRIISRTKIDIFYERESTFLGSSSTWSSQVVLKTLGNTNSYFETVKLLIRTMVICFGRVLDLLIV